MEKNTVKSRLQTLLKKSGLDLFDFAKKYNIEYTTINRIMTGETLKPTKPTIEAMAGRLGVSFDWLAFGEGPMEAPQKDTNPWKDVAFVQVANERDNLKNEVETWKKKYDQVWARLEFFQDRIPWEKLLGKLNPVKETALRAS